MLVRNIVDKFGGQTALAKLVGVNQSAIAYWVKRGSIPSKWHAKLMELARQNGLSLEAAELIEFEPQINAAMTNSLTEESDAGKASINLPFNNLATEKITKGINESFAHHGSQFLFYAADDGTIKVQVIIQNETVWMTQRGISELFDTSRENITIHLKNIFESKELDEKSVCKEILLAADDGKSYKTKLYNLDAIISVGYRVNSYQATQFRKWATTVLKSYLIKGFALDDERLKQGNQLFGKDYFDELLERIREIRASERRFYQKITDIYSQCSLDYDKDSPITHGFYAHVQDKLHFAIHGHTAAELIQLRADASKPNMGLYSYKNEKSGGKITKLDVTVGKNYLTEEEIDNLNRLVGMYLDFAENFARRHIPMKMQDWAEKLDGFLRFNAYEVLENYGTVRRETAAQRAISEFEKFRVVQDSKFKSDFDKVVDEIQAKKKLPKT